jgi:hypothetical protein
MRTTLAAATVLAAGALLGWLAASGKLKPLGWAAAAQSPADAVPAKPAESGRSVKPTCCDGVNKGQLLAVANRFAPGGAAPQPTTQTAPGRTPAAPSSDRPPRNIIFVICDQETYHLTAREDYKLPAR